MTEGVQPPTGSGAEGYLQAFTTEDTVFHLPALSINFSFFAFADVLAYRKEKGAVRVKQFVSTLYRKCW